MRNGTDKIISIKIGINYVPIGCLNSNSFAEQLQVIEKNVATLNGWKYYEGTNQTYSISGSGYITDATLDYYGLQNIKRNRTLVEWKISDGIDTETGQGYITELSNASNIDEFVSFSFTIVGFGECVTE